MPMNSTNMRRFGLGMLLASSAVCVHAQTNQGQLAGNVVDSTGAVVPNATVTAKGVENGSVYTVKSSGAGNYRFPSIGLGHYTITTEAPGFRQQVNTNVEVRVGTTTSLDINLSAGGQSDTVTVSADAPSVESESSDVGGNVNERQIIELPLALGGVGAMRSPEAFVFLIPGTAGPGTGNSNNGIFISKDRRRPELSATKFCWTAPARRVRKTDRRLTKKRCRSKPSRSSRSRHRRRRLSLAGHLAVLKTS